MRVPSVMPSQHAFSQVPRAEIPRSTFNRSFGHKTTFDADYLIPVFVDEALPGDTFNVSMTALARVTASALQRPLMDNMYLDSFFFAVPYRLVWANWQKFNGEQTNPGDSTSYTVPVFTADTPEAGTLHDYMGVPVEPLVSSAIGWVSLYARAYYLIYNQWFRDENLINSLTVPTGDGPDTYSSFVLQRRGKRHDYFTSALPWPQKGAAVLLPLGTSAPVKGIAQNTSADPTDGSPGGFLETGGGAPSGWAGYLNASSTNFAVRASQATAGGPPLIVADLTAATAATINQLRQAFQIQRMLERDARGGTRYIEIIKAHFGVTSPDARLQRPEYLGGGSTPITVSEIAQTSASAAPPTSVNAQGGLAGSGKVVVMGHGFTKSFTEHCIVMGIVAVRADLTYSQGMDRMFFRSTRYDFYWPALAHIGEQSVLSKEIYCTGAAGDSDVFGYQERYAEYRYKRSLLTGLFRVDAAGTLSNWHLSQKFTARPTLNQAFIESNTPMDRVVAVTTEPDFIFDSYFKFTAARPMPVYGVPGLIDHF